GRGTRAAMPAPAHTTLPPPLTRRYAPQGKARERAELQWKALASDPGARFDTTVEINAAQLAPFVTWGTSPAMAAPVTGEVPDPDHGASDSERGSIQRALEYMDLQPHTR